MMRGSTATSAASATKPSTSSASLSFTGGPLDSSHRDAPEEPPRPHEQHDEDQQQRRRQLQRRADEPNVALEHRDRQAEQDPPDDRADRAVEPAEHRGGEG